MRATVSHGTAYILIFTSLILTLRAWESMGRIRQGWWVLLGCNGRSLLHRGSGGVPQAINKGWTDWHLSQSLIKNHSGSQRHQPGSPQTWGRCKVIYFNPLSPALKPTSTSALKLLTVSFHSRWLQRSNTRGMWSLSSRGKFRLVMLALALWIC